MLLSLQQAILIRPEGPWMEAFAALPGGALLVLVSGIVENKYIKYMQTRYISYMTSRPVKMTGMILKTQSVNFDTSFWCGYCFAGRDGGCF